MKQVKIMAVCLLTMMMLGFSSFASDGKPVLKIEKKEVFKKLIFTVLVETPGGGCGTTSYGNPKPCFTCYTVEYTIGGGFIYYAGGNCAGSGMITARFSEHGVTPENDIAISGAICEYWQTQPEAFTAPCPIQ